MNAEDVDLDKLTLTPHQQPLNYLCDRELIIFKAIKEIRSKKKRLEVLTIYD